MSSPSNDNKVNNSNEVTPKGQSSIVSDTSSIGGVGERDFSQLPKCQETSPCEANIDASLTSLEQKIFQNPQKAQINCDIDRIDITSDENLAQGDRTEEVLVEIMAPCYGSVCNVNNIEDIEGGNNNSFYLSDDDKSETTTLLPKNANRQHGNDNNESDDTKLQNMAELPKDSYNYVYGSFFLLGLSTLLPWNFFISINQFWDYRFRDVNSTEFIYDFVTNVSHTLDAGNQTELQKEFTSYLSIASNVPNAIFVILNAVYGARISIRKRLLVSGSVIILLFLGMTMLAKTNSDTWQTEFLYIVLTLVVFINIFAATFQSGVFGVAGKFPPKYMGSTMVGQAFGGVFPALVDILVVAINVEPENEGMACLIIATLSLLLSFVAFIGTGYSSFFRYYAGEELLNGEVDSESATNNGQYQRLNEQNSSQSDSSAYERLSQVMNNSWEYCLSVFLTFFITLSLWPAVAVLVESQFKNSPTRSTWANDYFTPVCVFLLFNVGDLIGRSIANAIKLPDRTRSGKMTVLILTLLRAVFIPLYIFCNASPQNRSLPVIFSSDADFIIITTIFALSNGYLGNICMLHGPKTQEDSALQEETAMVLVACLVLGTGCGSFLSLPITRIL